MTRVFISHSSADSEFVESQIIPFLNRHGIATWYSKLDIFDSSSQWMEAVRDGLFNSEWFMVLMSPNSEKSQWVRDEMHWAVNNREFQIIPVVIGNCDTDRIHLRLARLQHYDIRSPNEEKMRERILKLIRTGGENSGEPPETSSVAFTTAPFEDEVRSSHMLNSVFGDFGVSSTREKQALVKTLAMTFAEISGLKGQIFNGLRSVDALMQAIINHSIAPALREAIKRTFEGCIAVLRYSALLVAHPLYDQVITETELVDDQLSRVALLFTFAGVSRDVQLSGMDSVKEFMRICVNKNDCRNKLIWEYINASLPIAKGYVDMESRVEELARQVTAEKPFDRVASAFDGTNTDDRRTLSLAVAMMYESFRQSGQGLLAGAKNVGEFLRIIELSEEPKLRKALLVSKGTVWTVLHYRDEFMQDEYFRKLNNGQPDRIQRGFAAAMALAYRGLYGHDECTSVQSLDRFLAVLAKPSDCRYQRLIGELKQMSKAAKLYRAYFEPQAVPKRQTFPGPQPDITTKRHTAQRKAVSPKDSQQGISHTPGVLDTSGIILPPELRKLHENLAKNTHEIWAARMTTSGWKQGVQRDEQKKHHPLLIPYEQLPESKKELHRKNVDDILKAVIALGYRIVDTD